MIPFAHSLPGQPESQWEELPDHLRKVSVLAEQFGSHFGSAAWGRLAGLWHDLGKYSQEFQNRIRGERVQVEHAGPGAVHAHDRKAYVLASVIAGHHAGLADLQTGGGGLPSLVERVARNRALWGRMASCVPLDLLQAEIPALPDWLALGGQDERRRSAEFWTRMLLSALVDADWLATESFCNPSKSSQRATGPDLRNLAERLDRHLRQFEPTSSVNEVRRRVLDACRAAVEWPTGLFSLTVPTGGGKTLSGMAFALGHAVKYGLRRVVVAIPYTSIIEQNAEVYRDVFGPSNVVEHHSALDETALREASDELETRRRLATENWDAPVIVTTNVQLFESLFSNHPSRCRKLHNLACSVILLDEAQALPPELLLPVLDGIRELVAHYGCSMVLMSATQPALRRRDALPGGLENVREIYPDPSGLAVELTRVRVSWPASAEAMAYDDVAARMSSHRQVLAVVHRRADAHLLARLLPAAGRFHLSALMCPAHRSEQLSAIRTALREGEVCRAVTTQLIEAGVDVDFPVVLRALAGIDSLLQAAGRCNREGRLTGADGRPALGDYVVFRAATEPPAGLLRRGLEATELLITRHGQGLNLMNPAHVEEYFRVLYTAVPLDRRAIQTARAEMAFATVAERFRMIDDGFLHPVVVPWGDAPVRLARYRANPERATMRGLQPFVVQVHGHHLRNLEQLGAVESVGDRFWAILPQYAHLYDPGFGLRVDTEADPVSLIV